MSNFKPTQNNKNFSYFYYDDFFNLRRNTSINTDLNGNASPYSPRTQIIIKENIIKNLNMLINEEPFFKFDKNNIYEQLEN
jgi:hypothetical protein